MSGKLLECRSRGRDSELFVVEGKSALHAVDQVRDRQTQAVLSMQGKVPNAGRHPVSKILANTQCKRLFEVLGCGVAQDCSTERLRYGRVLILADGDADGLHARTLLLTLFQRCLQPLLAANKIGVITAPCSAIPAKAQENTTYLWTQQDRQRHLEGKSRPTNQGITVFKGVASLPGEEIYRLLIDPATRREQIPDSTANNSENNHA